MSHLFRSLWAFVFVIGLAILSSCSEDSTTTPQLLTPPTILGQSVSEISHQSVMVKGWVDGHGRSLVCWFEHGNNISYGARTPDMIVEATGDSSLVEYRINGLNPETLYWWRLVAVAGTDTVFASDTSFTTMMQSNEPPMTFTTIAPGDHNPFNFYWNGSDMDGAVVGYRWRLSDNGLSGIGEADTLGLPWNFTTVTDSLFTVSADFPAPREPGDTGPRIFFRPHTFWIKAVDNLGFEDPSPAQISFTAVTEAPEIEVHILPSMDPNPNGCLELPLPISFTWTASDSDSSPGALLEVRTLLVSLSDLGISTCLTQDEYEELDPLTAMDEGLWNEWVEYDPQAQVQPTFALGPEHLGERYLFAAMARDEAGAWTEELTWGSNVWLVEVLSD